jgi:phosphatidylinositol-3,4,5-trisphosphate 3-phosphatase/dual-specificity protein phosphatase PTEN
LKLLFTICEKIHKFFEKDDENVVVVNCRAGKGRTGTIVCCYLLFSGRFKNPEEAFLYYSRKRFRKGGGVTQPSQKNMLDIFIKCLLDIINFLMLDVLLELKLKNFQGIIMIINILDLILLFF